MAYWDLGIDEFILSGFPHVEECERVAEQVLPLVKEQMSPTEELECARRLLIDDDADDPRWVIDVIKGGLPDGEELLIEDLVTKF